MIGAVVVALLLQQGAAPGRATPRPDADASRLRMGIVVQPETVTVGDPFRVVVRVRAPVGATIDFPQSPDSAGDVEALDTPRVDTVTVADAVDHTAHYRLVAWNVGRVAVGLPDVRVRTAGGERTLSLAGLAIEVRSVLPADSALRIPKPQRPPIAAPIPWWVWALLALAALALVALLVWLWRRRRGRRPPALVVDPYDAAQREFARVEALGLVDAGERGRYAALMVDVLREYLAARVDGAALSLTSRELLAALRGHREVPAPRLAPLLEEVDHVKFARRAVTPERAREIGREARAIVGETEKAERERAERARADAARAASDAAERGKHRGAGRAA
jgi:hypothetical protein